MSSSFLDISVSNEISYFFENRGVSQIPPKNSCWVVGAGTKEVSLKNWNLSKIL